LKFNVYHHAECKQLFFHSVKHIDFRGSTPKKFEDEGFEALLHKDPCQTLTELVESLGIDHATVSKHLKVLGMIQKQEHWMPYDLKPRDVERRLSTL